jgi:hypothetical protein
LKDFLKDLPGNYVLLVTRGNTPVFREQLRVGLRQVSSSRVAAASRSGGSFFYIYPYSLKDSVLLCVLPRKTWSGLGLRARQSESGGCCPASSGQQLLKFVKIDSLTYSAPHQAAVIPPMSDVPVSESKESHPATKNIAVVQCEGFRCLAYRDAEIWRDFQTGKELPEVKSVVFSFSV